MNKLYDIFGCFLIVSAVSLLTTVNTFSNYISDSLFVSQRDNSSYEIDEIIFEGNKSFSSNELGDLLNSQENSLSFHHVFYQYYYDNLKQNPSTPKVALQTLNKFLIELSSEIKFFNEQIVLNDLQTLWRFYNTNGFHNVEVDYSFYPDFEKEINILRFEITEHDRFKIDTIVYVGFEELDKGVLNFINTSRTIKKGEFFSEQKVLAEVSTSQNILLNSGYYYTTAEVQPIVIKSETNTDSITVVFKTGKRQRIAAINFVDSLNNQNYIVESMKLQQLDFRRDDWYNRSKVQSSINNLHTLGTFEFVSIDTSSIFTPITDTTLSMLVLTKYRKQKEWGIGLFVNNTQVDNFINAGVEANILHRNWGGAAQSGNIFINTRMKNVSRFFAGQNVEYEGQVGIRLAQPLIWAIENMRIGVTGCLYYSLTTVDRLFNISAWYMPIRFPIKLTEETYIDQIVIDFNFEYQNPVNYVDVEKEFDSENPQNRDNIRIEQALLLYRNLYEYLYQPGTKFLTSNIFGITLIGDSRNHPFNPSSGDNFYFSVDGWNIFLSHPWIAGVAKYMRAQTMYTLFLPLNIDMVGAFKFRAGAINLVEDVNSYVPFERQFFAGGANSVRGWLSRELHYSPLESAHYTNDNETSDLVINTEDYALLSNVLGSSAIFEGSFELRYTFPPIKGINETLADQISKIGLTFFVDYGNAFHWYAEGEVESKMIWYEYFTKIAWAAGLGLRYNTPIGPIRFDVGFPVYRPGYNIPDYYLWKSNSVWNDVKFHFGIGHSF